MPNLVGGSIVWNLDVDSKKFDAGVDSARNKAKGLSNDLNDGSKSLSGLSGSLSSAASASTAFAGALAAVGAGLATAIGFSVKYAADLESMRAGFITLLGSADAADTAIKQIQKDAASTPFNFSGLVAANQQLTSVTGNAQESERFLLNVGKALTAMGKGQPELDRIIVNLQQIGAVGHASAIDLKQFAFAGIPIYKLLNEQLKGTGQNLDDLVSSGQITFTMLEDLFNKAGEGSGRFSRAFIEQGGTMNQVWSNFIDNLGIAGSQIVKQTGIFDALKNALKGVTNALAFWASPEGTKKIIEFLGIMKANLPIIIGLLAGGLAPALWAVAAPLLASLGALLPFIAAGVAVGAVVQLLVNAFGGWGKVLEAVGQAYNTFLKPAVDDLIKNFQKLIPSLQELWRHLGPVLMPVLKALGMILGAVVIEGLREFVMWLDAVVIGARMISDAINGTINFFQKFGNTLSRVFGGLKAVFVDFFTGGDVTATWYEHFKTTFMGIAILLDNLQHFFMELPQTLATVGQAIVTWFGNLPTMIRNALVQSALSFVEFLGFLTGLVVAGVPVLISTIVTFFTGLPAALSAIWTQISTDVVNLFTSMGAWLAVNIPLMLGAVLAFFVNGFTAIWNWLRAVVPQIINSVVSFFATLPARIGEWLQTTQKTTQSGFMDIWNSIVAEISKWPGQLYDWGVRLMNSLADGIKSAIGAIADAFKAGMDKAKKLVEGHSPPIAGPFKDIDKWGFNIGQSWIDGIKTAISGFSMPTSELAYQTSGMNMRGADFGDRGGSVTHSPNITISLGNFIGTENEKRKFAYDLQVALDQYYKGRGQQ